MPPSPSFPVPVLPRLLPLALTLALMAPGLALAQSSKEAELEARIAELERLVAELRAERAATAAATPAATTAAPASPTTSGAVAAAAPPAPASVPVSMPTASAGTRLSIGGFIKFDASVSDSDAGQIAEGTAGRMFHLPAAIPVGGQGGDAYTDFGAQFSRLWIAADHQTDAGDKVKAHLEVDFFGGGSNNLGNEVATNTHGVTLRHAYVSWNRWLAGQTWSNFMDTAALPEAVDFVGVTDGTVFVRQAQVRYTRGDWSFSAENPQTTVLAHGGGSRYNSGDNVLPDFTARWQKKGDWGHVSVAALLRQYKDGEESANGASLSVSGRFNLGPQDDLRYTLNHGKGIGRYLAFGLGPDTLVEADGSLSPLGGSGGFVAWRHAFNPRLRSNLMYAAAHFDNDTDLTGLGITRSTQTLRANLIYSPLPKLDVGAEISWGERQLENGQEGEIKRLQTTVKYSF